METKYIVNCPVCGSPHIEYNDCVDEYYDVSTHYSIWEGKCLQCDSKLEWKEEYKLTNILDMKVVEEGEQSSSLILY